MQNVDYEQLVPAAVNGNAAAFRKLYDISSPRAYYAALCITKNEKDAVNIIQNSYATMRERLPRLKYPQMFENWFYRIVCRCIFDYAVKLNSALFDSFNALEVSAFNDELDEGQIRGYDPDNAQRDKAMVTRILDHLPIDRRLCFLMYYYFKMNIAEISKILSVDEMIIAHFLDEAKRVVKANILDVFASQNRVLNCPPISFYSYVLSSCSSHVPFRATDMIMGNLFNINRTPTAPPSYNQPRNTTISESASTQMYSNEEMERLLDRHARPGQNNPYGKESSKGGNGEDDIPAAKSVSTIVKIVLIVLVGIIFVIAVIALMKNVISDNETPTTAPTISHSTITEYNEYTEYETVATTAEETEPETTETTTETTTEATTYTSTTESTKEPEESYSSNIQDNDYDTVTG